MLEFVIVFLGIVADQLTKHWATTTLATQPIEVLPGVGRFTYVQNTGAAFGIFQNGTLFLTIFSAIAVAGFIFLLIHERKKESVLFRIGIACIVSGALGNLIDRIILGYVVDFIEVTFIQFPVFNVADSLTTIGIFLFAVAIIFLSKSNKKKIVEQPIVDSQETQKDA